MLPPNDERAGMRNLKSRAKAIELMCKRCCYFPEKQETWRQQVEDLCPDNRCPLYNFRPCVGGEARKAHKLARFDSKPQLKLE